MRIISQILKVIFVLNPNFVSPTHAMFHNALRIYICVCVSIIHIYIHTYTYIYMNVIYIYLLYVCVYIYVFVSMYIYIYMYVYIYMALCLCEKLFCLFHCSNFCSLFNSSIVFNYTKIYCAFTQ